MEWFSKISIGYSNESIVSYKINSQRKLNKLLI